MHAQLVVEPALFGGGAEHPGGFQAELQGAFPGAPAQRQREGGGGGPGQAEDLGGAVGVPFGEQHGEDDLGFGGDLPGGDRGVADPPGEVLCGAVRDPAGGERRGQAVAVVLDLGEQRVEHALGEAVVAADGDRQSGVDEFLQGALAEADVDQGGQVRGGRALAAEGEGQAQHQPGRLAEALDQAAGGRGALADRGQRHLAAQFPFQLGRVAGRFVLLDGAEHAPPVLLGGDQRVDRDVPLAQQGGGPDEAQRQALGLEPEVDRPGPFGVVQLAAGQPGGEGQAGGTGQAGDQVVAQPRAGGRGRAVGDGGQQERALGGEREQVLQFLAERFDVVDHHHRGDAGQQFGQLFAVGAEVGGLVGDGEQVLEQVGGGAPVAAEPHHAVGGEFRGGFGDGGEQGGAAGAGLAEQPDRAAGPELFEQRGDVALAVQQPQVGGAGAQGERSDGGAGAEFRPGLHQAADPAGLRHPLVRAVPGLGALRPADHHQPLAADQFPAPRAHPVPPELPARLTHVAAPRHSDT
nr:hypothetical protein RKE32_21535 [Streptomyces sp. Li-HN-5-13]